MQLLERLWEELLVLVSVLLWVGLRLAGVIQKVLSEGKEVKVQIGRREIIHLARKDGNLSLEVLPIGKNTYHVYHVERAKDNLTQQEKEEIPRTKELGSQKTTSHISYSQMEGRDLLVKEVCQVQEHEKEVNTKC
jgi:hypothetical protein